MTRAHPEDERGRGDIIVVERGYQMVEPWSFLTTLFPSSPTLHLRKTNRFDRSIDQDFGDISIE